MPKKNATGGKKHRRAKNVQENNFVDIPSEDQYFAKVTKILGSGKISCNYYIPQLNLKTNNIDWEIKESMGIIRGKMMRRIWINLDDIILVTERDFDKNKVDVIEKFNQSQLSYLKNKIAFPKINIIQDDDICFVAQKTKKAERIEKISYDNLYNELDEHDAKHNINNSDSENNNNNNNNNTMNTMNITHNSNTSDNNNITMNITNNSNTSDNTSDNASDNASDNTSDNTSDNASDNASDNEEYDSSKQYESFKQYENDKKESKEYSMDNIDNI